MALRGNLDDGMNAKINLSNSHLASNELNAHGFINVNREGINDSNLSFIVGPNHLYLKGNMDKTPGQLVIDLNMPHLDYLGIGLTGEALMKGIFKGTFREPNAHLTGYFHEVKVRNYLKITSLNFVTELSQNRFAPFKVLIDGSDIKILGAEIEKIHSLFTGTLANHRGSISLILNFPGQHAFMGNYIVHGGVNDEQQWLGTLEAFNLQGVVNILLRRPVKMMVSREAVSFGPASWKALGGDKRDLNYAGQSLCLANQDLTLKEQPKRYYPCQKNNALDALLQNDENAKLFLVVKRRPAPLIHSSENAD